jgi:hypothetical protein
MPEKSLKEAIEKWKYIKEKAAKTPEELKSSE